MIRAAVILGVIFALLLAWLVISILFHLAAGLVHLVAGLTGLLLIPLSYALSDAHRAILASGSTPL